MITTSYMGMSIRYKSKKEKDKIIHIIQSAFYQEQISRDMETRVYIRNLKAFIDNYCSGGKYPKVTLTYNGEIILDNNMGGKK